jgi:hypothetical protein
VWIRVRRVDKIALGLDICNGSDERCFLDPFDRSTPSGDPVKVRCSDLPRDSNIVLNQPARPGVIVRGRPFDPNCRSPLCGSALRPYDHGKSTVNDSIDI